MENYSRKELVKICKEYNKTAVTKINCDSDTETLRVALQDFVSSNEGRKDLSGTALTSGSISDTIDVLKKLSPFELQTYCDAHASDCNYPGLWKRLFAEVFPDVYSIFRSMTLPDIEGSTTRQFMPWRTLYSQLLEISAQPYTLRAVDAILNREEKPLDEWRREELEQYDYLSLALALWNPFYVKELAKDNSVLLNWIPFTPQELVSTIRKSPVPRFMAKYYLLTDRPHLKIKTLFQAASRAIEFDNIDIFKLVLEDLSIQIQKEGKSDKPVSRFTEIYNNLTGGKYITEYVTLILTAAKFDRKEILKYIIQSDQMKIYLKSALADIVNESIVYYRSEILQLLLEYYRKSETKFLTLINIKAVVSAFTHVLEHNDYSYINTLVPYLSEPHHALEVRDAISYLLRNKKFRKKVKEIIEYLLTKSDLDLWIILEFAFHYAEESIVDLLLGDSRSDEYFSEEPFYLTAIIAQGGRYVQKILSDPRSNPGSVANQVTRMIFSEYRQGNDLSIDALKLWLEDTRVRDALDQDFVDELETIINKLQKRNQ